MACFPRLVLTCIATSLLTLSHSPATHADTITVCPTGCDSTSIQGGINQAAPGDEVFLATAVDHIENDIVVFTSITLRGLPGLETNLRATTSSDPTPRILTVLAGIELTIEDLVIRDGYTFDDGGAINNQGTLNLRGARISSNRADRGAAVFNTGTLDCFDSALVNNSAIQGGAVFNAAGATFTGDDCYQFNNELLEANVLLSDASGGHLHNEGHVDLRNSSLLSASSPAHALTGGLRGGGIYSEVGTLILDNCYMGNNHIGSSFQGEGGGALYLQSGSAVISHTRIANNSTEGNGGGIYVGFSAELQAFDVIVRGNRARVGGGILQAGNALIRGATIEGNEASSGAGIFVDNNGIDLANATISGNLATGSGGGIYVSQQRSIQIASTTIVDNEADVDQNDIGNGGGIYLEPLSGCSGICITTTAYLKNSILANNVDRSPTTTQAHDCHGDLRSNGPNLLEQVSTSSFAACELVGSSAGVIFGTDPGLGPLADNGGPSISSSRPWTHLPGEASPARNAGDPNGCLDYSGAELTSDQRMAPRVGTCDLGAVEGGSSPQPGEIFADGFESGNVLAWQ